MDKKSETPQTLSKANKEAASHLENSLESEKVKAILSFDIIRTRNPISKEIIYRCVEINGVHSDFPNDMMDFNDTLEGKAITDHIKRRLDESNRRVYGEKILKACQALLDLSIPSSVLITEKEKSFFSFFFTSLKIHKEHPDFNMDLNITVLNDHILPILARSGLEEYRLEFMKLLGNVLLLTENEWSSGCNLDIQLITEDKARQINYVDVRCFTRDNLKTADWTLGLHSSTGAWIIKKRDGSSGEWNHVISNKEFVSRVMNDPNPKDFLKNVLDTYVIQEFYNKIPDNTDGNSDTGDLRIHVEVEIDHNWTIKYQKCFVLAVSKEWGLKSVEGNLKEFLIKQVSGKISKIVMDTKVI